MLGMLASSFAAFYRDVQNNELDCIAKSDIHQCTNCVSHSLGHAFGRMAEKSCQGYDGNRIHPKDDSRAEVSSFGSNTDGYEDQQDVDVAGQYNGFASMPKAQHDVFLCGLLIVYDIPLPISLRRWSWWRVFGGGIVDGAVRISRCVVCEASEI